jgi:hypothetical protein
MLQKPGAKQAKLIYLISYRPHDIIYIFTLAHEKNYLKEQQYK